jgi:hypothetical protein
MQVRKSLELTSLNIEQSLLRYEADLLLAMTATKVLSWGSPVVRIPKPLLHCFDVCHLVHGTLPRALSAIPEWIKPCIAGRGDGHQTNGPQRGRLALCELPTGEVSLQRLPPRKLAPLFRSSLARAWALPDLGEVPHAMLRTHVRVFEGHEAVVDAAV